MNELDLIDALADRRDASFLLKKIKTASAKDVLVNAAKTYGPSVAAGAVGAGLMAGASYILDKPKGDGSHSRAQEAAAKYLESAKAEASKNLEEGKPVPFATDLKGMSAQGTKDFADFLARHPARGSLLFVPTGFGLGVGAHSIVKGAINKVLGKK